MCYHGKCFMCIPVETGSFICAIIITVLTALTLLISFIFGCLTATGNIFGIYVSYTSHNSYGSYESSHRNPNGGVAAAFFLLAATALAGLVFAVLLCRGISKVLTASTLLISFVLGCFTATGQLFGQYIGSYGYIPNGGVTTAFYLLAATALAGLVFAILLCRGISKRRPSFIKAYFIYGVVLTAVTVVVAVGMLLGGFQIVSVFLLVSCVIYSLFLVLVQKAYFKILEGGENGTVLKQNQNQLIE